MDDSGQPAGGRRRLAGGPETLGSRVTSTGPRGHLILVSVLGLGLLSSSWWLPHEPTRQYRVHAWSAPSLRPPTTDRTDPTTAPARGFLFGTDQLGRDLFSRFVAGARTSLVAALAATILTVAVATTVGLVAAGLGGMTELLLMAAGDAAAAAPWLVVVVALRSALPLDVPPSTALAVIALVIAAASWPRPARHVRATAVALAQENYVLAARASGATPFHIARRHILPHLVHMTAERGAVLLPRALMAEITLSGLGLGVSEPTPSWGALVGGLQRAASVGMYWWTLLPVLGMIVFLWWATRLADSIRGDDKEFEGSSTVR